MSKQPIWHVLLAVIFACVLAGCAALSFLGNPAQDAAVPGSAASNSPGPASEGYQAYARFVDGLNASFRPEGFVCLESGTGAYWSTSFPENGYFAERDDLECGNPLWPKRRVMVFRDSGQTLGVSVTCLYSEEALERRFLSIDSFPEELAVGMEADAQNLLAESYEMILEEGHCITLLKFYPLRALDPAQEAEVKQYRERVVSFFQSYCTLMTESGS